MHTRLIVSILLLILTGSLYSCKQDQSLDDDLYSVKVCYINKDMDGALALLEQIENKISDDTPLAEKELFERIKGAVYFELALPDQSKQSFTRALEYAILLNDTSSILVDSHNLTAYAGVDPSILENALTMCREQDSTICLQILEKLTLIYLDQGNLEQAIECYDELENSGYGNIGQLKYDKALIALLQDSIAKARNILMALDIDSFNIYGKCQKYMLLKNIAIANHDYKEALSFNDTLTIYSDSIKNIKGLERIQKSENEFRQYIQAEKTRFQIILYSSITLLSIAIIIILIIAHNLKMRRRQIELTNKIAELNVALERLQQSGEKDIVADNTEEIASLIRDKFTLSYDIFVSTPEYDIIKKLVLMHVFGPEHAHELTQLRNGIVGRFSDACSDLRVNFPAMTNDDCLFCAINVCKCSREIQSSLMAVSEDTLRKRKSRIKPKIPTSLFNYFFA